MVYISQMYYKVNTKSLDSRARICYDTKKKGDESGMPLVPVCFAVMVIAAWFCIKKAGVFESIAFAVFRVLAILTYIAGFAYGYAQMMTNYRNTFTTWFAAFSVGSIFLALSEILRLLRPKK